MSRNWHTIEAVVKEGDETENGEPLLSNVCLDMNLVGSFGRLPLKEDRVFLGDDKGSIITVTTLSFAEVYKIVT